MALKLSHKISLLFGGNLANASPSQQLSMAMMLIRALDHCSSLSDASTHKNDVVLSGLKIGIGNGFGIDPSGTLWLHSQADENDWIQFLNNTDINECHKKQLHYDNVRVKEVNVAKLLGISAVLFHTPSQTKYVNKNKANDGNEFERFLDRALDTAHNAVPTPAPGVSLHVLPAGKNDPIQCTTDSTGKIFVPVTISGPSLLAMIQKLTPEASRCAALKRKEEAAMATLRTQVERKLKLRQLLCHPDVPPHKFRAACLRLLNESSTVKPLLDGLSVRIAEVNGFVPGLPYIDIAWNFHL